jgi:hypothetical protein
MSRQCLGKALHSDRCWNAMKLDTDQLLSSFINSWPKNKPVLPK